MEHLCHACGREVGDSVTVKVALCFGRESAWTTAELQDAIDDETPKRIANALGYHVRRGFLIRLGYGRYRKA